MRLRAGTIYLALFILGCLVPLVIRGNEYYLHVYIMCVINVIMASSLRAIATTGQMSIGQAGFMAIGAYMSAILAVKFNVPVYGGPLAGGLAAMALAALIGYPLSRVRTVYFVMVTMFLGEIIRLVLFEWRGMTGGSTGMMGIPRVEILRIPGILQINFGDKFYFCYLALALLFLILLVLYNIDRSHPGTVLAAIGQEEALASSVGINVARYKVMIFCVGSFFTGLAGALYAHYMTVLNPDAFGMFSSIYVLVYVAVGGKKFAGPIAGAIILTLIPELFGVLKEYQTFVFVLVLFLVVFLLPRGLSSLPERVGPQIKRMLK
jgi:branched-chain amino acid transport system permease protein